MSLSAALSIFASASGLVPNGGEGASGDDGLFANLIEADAAATDASVAVKATTPGRNADPVDAAADLADERETAAAPSDGPVPTPQTVPIAQSLIAFPAPPAEAGTAGSPRIDADGFSAPVPSPHPGNGTSEAAEAKRAGGHGAVPLPAASNTIETISSPVPAKPVAGVSAEVELPAASPPANDHFGARLLTEAAGPLPSIGLSGDAGARAKDQTPTLASSANPAGRTDRTTESPAALTSSVAGSEPVEAGKQAAGTLVAADVTAHSAGRDARPARAGIQPRPIFADRSQTAAGGLATPTDDATPEDAIDPAMVRAGRGSNAPVAVAPPPLAPALANTLQTDGNAAVVSPEAAAPDEKTSPGSGRATGSAVDTRVATAAMPDIARPLAETVPLAVADPSTAPDTVSLEARVESPPETVPATPAAVTASGLSRASIETTAVLAAQIARRLEGRSTRFDMALTPEGLGRVDVRVEIDADGQLAARLAFDNPAAAAELRGRADELRRQLEDAGFTLSQDALDFSEREPSSGGQGAFERQQRRAAYAHRLSSEPDLGAVPAAWSPHPGTPRGVDVKV